ncbi:hypothetical protein IEQ34_020931 [Dendrobium chrysotoxum]|uniref:Uncharacterized protein n=1 Tax=Dendrobium chrysotoxum TaxID=161865 RepID=A0AAV7FKV9_DENCH|nr:hypothetical protein IEQ34_020931 [Dendrobium chrysotoxum]
MDPSAEFSQSSGWSVSRTASPWVQMGNPWTSKNGAATDKEAEVFWSALENLQSSDRQRTGTIDERPALYKYEDVDVAKMGPTDRRLFIDRILRTADEDNAAFLKKLRHRIDNAGVQLPTVEVRFENITIRANCHVGTRALPTLLNESINLIESLFGLFGVRPTQMTKLNILNNISGVIRPSRMTLLLGPPSSGKTTLLLALAGKLQKSVEVSGDVTYNGYELREFFPQKTAAYISQYDMHTGEMTVKETLSFSERCQGVGERYGVQILGLDICSDTIVGDGMKRGISGGQRKRVSGDVTYNGYELSEFFPQKTAAYISQYDMHTGEMTVKETLSFSERCQGVGERYGKLIKSYAS